MTEKRALLLNRAEREQSAEEIMRKLYKIPLCDRRAQLECIADAIENIQDKLASRIVEMEGVENIDQVKSIAAILLIDLL